MHFLTLFGKILRGLKVFFSQRKFKLHRAMFLRSLSQTWITNELDSHLVGQVANYVSLECLLDEWKCNFSRIINKEKLFPWLRRNNRLKGATNFFVDTLINKTFNYSRECLKHFTKLLLGDSAETFSRQRIATKKAETFFLLWIKYFQIRNFCCVAVNLIVQKNVDRKVFRFISFASLAPDGQVSFLPSPLPSVDNAIHLQWSFFGKT